MAITKQQLAALSNEELQEVANMIGSIVIGRKNERQKELWGNVVAAIKKYETETGKAVVFSGPRDVPDFTNWSSSCTGIIDIS